MTPFLQTLYSPSGQLGARPARLERVCSARMQPLETAEAPEQARNIRSPDAVESGSILEATEASARVISPEVQGAVQSIAQQTSISDRLLRSNLAGSVTDWLDNLGSSGMW